MIINNFFLIRSSKNGNENKNGNEKENKIKIIRKQKKYILKSNHKEIIIDLVKYLVNYGLDINKEEQRSRSYYSKLGWWNFHYFVYSKIY